MKQLKIYCKILSIAIGASLMAAVSASTAAAGVDIWNEDGVSYHVIVIEKTSEKKLTLAASKSSKSICGDCVIKISPMENPVWSDQIIASGQDVITIEQGRLRIGEGISE